MKPAVKIPKSSSGARPGVGVVLAFCEQPRASGRLGLRHRREPGRRATVLRLPVRVAAAVSSFGGGHLLAAVALELVPDADERAGQWLTAVGLFAGMLIYVGADAWLSRNEERKAMLALGPRRGSGSPDGDVPRNGRGGVARRSPPGLDHVPESIARSDLDPDRALRVLRGEPPRRDGDCTRLRRRLPSQLISGHATVDTLAAVVLAASTVAVVAIVLAVIVVIGGLVYVVRSAGRGRTGPRGPAGPPGPPAP
jgi:hypothetical protein